MDLREAARQLGVHYQTAYRWVREGALAAVKVGPSYQVEPEEVSRVAARRTAPLPPPRRVAVRRWDAVAARLTDLLVEGDELGCRQLVDRLAQGAVEPAVLFDVVIGPALHRIGGGWEHGRLSIGVEHRATAICERLVARAAAHPRGRPRGQCVVSAPPGERHALPAAMAAVVLRADRWQVHHLGADIPAAEVGGMARAVGASLVVLSTASEAGAASAVAAAAGLARPDVRVLVGRPGDRLAQLVKAARGTRPAGPPAARA